jgi:hypothetical protein
MASSGMTRRVLAHAEHGGHPREHARAQFQLRLSMQPRTPIERPLVSSSGSTAITSALKLRAGKRVDFDLRGLAGADLGLVALGQAEVDVHRVEVLDVHDVAPSLR